MKSPDRDAADELAIEQVHALALWFDDQADTRRFMFVMKIASELATLRRRVAEIELDNDHLRQALCDASDTANGGEGKRGYELDPLGACAEIMQICEAALSPPTRKE